MSFEVPEPSAAADLTCRELVELVTEYLEDALSPSERARFEAHPGPLPGLRNLPGVNAPDDPLDWASD